MAAQPIPLSPKKEKPPDDWRGQYAYTIGMQACIYGFPYVYMSEVRWGQVAQQVDPKSFLTPQ
jgi:hypothetical protein